MRINILFESTLEYHKAHTSHLAYTECVARGNFRAPSSDPENSLVTASSPVAAEGGKNLRDLCDTHQMSIQTFYFTNQGKRVITYEKYRKTSN